MLSRRKTLLAALSAVSIAFASPAWAHKANRVETGVTLNPDGGVEITHVLQLSTAQRLLFKTGVIDKNDLSGLKARAQAAIYVSERFELNVNGRKLNLETVGAELAGGHLYVYQTSIFHEFPNSWSAKNTILRDISPRFDNIVNVPTGNGIQTLVFRGSDLDAVQSTN